MKSKVNIKIDFCQLSSHFDIVYLLKNNTHDYYPIDSDACDVTDSFTFVYVERTVNVVKNSNNLTVICGDVDSHCIPNYESNRP